MSNSNYFPTTAKEIAGFTEILYLEGLPREYRFDAKLGVVKRGKASNITQPGERFSVIPLAYRIFEDELYAYEKKAWLELFFLDKTGSVSVMSFHGFSVDSFRDCAADLFYEKKRIEDSLLTITPTPKSSEKGSYYIAEFSADAISDKDLEVIGSVVNSIPGIYKIKTARLGDGNDVSINYGFSVPPSVNELPGANEA